jgi:Domain of unknown function (DUF4258)
LTALSTNELLKKIREHVRQGTFLVSAHALQRQNQRLVGLQHVLYALKNGNREENKELFDVKRQVWKYAIRGKTIDGINLRVIVTLEEKMIIITVVRLK